MSKLEQVLFIQPPLFLQDHPVIRKVSDKHQCTVCNGFGKVSGPIYDKDSRFEECPFCKGAKKIKAVITIEWMPDNKE